MTSARYPRLRGAAAAAAIAAALVLTACNQSDPAASQAALSVPDLPATLPLVVGQPTELRYAPAVEALPSAGSVPVRAPAFVPRSRRTSFSKCPLPSHRGSERRPSGSAYPQVDAMFRLQMLRTDPGCRSAPHETVGTTNPLDRAGRYSPAADADPMDVDGIARRTADFRLRCQQCWPAMPRPILQVRAELEARSLTLDAASADRQQTIGGCNLYD